MSFFLKKTYKIIAIKTIYIYLYKNRNSPINVPCNLKQYIRKCINISNNNHITLYFITKIYSTVPKCFPEYTS